jgi:pimeloyl-ACP methyl ester carboxylesterase
VVVSAEFPSRRLRIGRHRLAYDVFGPEDAPRTLVYLHGLLLDSAINVGIAEAAASRGVRVVVLDLLGHGRSDHPLHASDYRMDRYADQVVALLDHLGLDRAVLGGVSLGANVSLFAAVAAPERVEGLVLEMPVLERAVPAAAAAFAPVLVATQVAAPVLDAVAWCAGKVPPTGFGPLDSVVRSGARSSASTAAVLHGILVGPIAPTMEQRASIVAPTLVLAHRNDLIHPFDDAVRLAAVLPNSELLRTWSSVELRLFPRRIIGRVLDFVDDLPDSPTASVVEGGA